MTELETFLEQWVDQQIGLDSARFCTTFKETNIRISAIKPSKSESQRMIQEWRDTATDLIDALSKEDFGVYVLSTVSSNHCELMKE